MSTPATARETSSRSSVVERLSGMLEKDLAAVETLLNAKAASPVDIIPAMSEHIGSAGGKRLRPMITLAAAQAFCAEKGGHFLSPFDDDDVIEGQASVAVEIEQQLGRAPDHLVIPVGGGRFLM